MRRYHRPRLESGLQDFLTHRQKEVAQGQPEGDSRLWKSARQTRDMRAIAGELAAMTGPRERCMYCEDSRGTDIEHYWPKARYRERIFQWANMLLICAGCNRSKGDRLPLGEDGQPLVIEPTSEQPWDHLFYDSRTGELAPRWDPDSGQPSVKGDQTLECLSTLRHQAVVEGRARTRRNLARAVRTFLNHSGTRSVADASLAELREALVDNVEYGLVSWYFERDGQSERPFATLRDEHPETWAQLQAFVRSIGARSGPAR